MPWRAPRRSGATRTGRRRPRGPGRAARRHRGPRDPPCPRSPRSPAVRRSVTPRGPRRGPGHSQGPPAREPGVEWMPVRDAILAHAPAQVDALALAFGREVDEPDLRIAQQDVVGREAF